MDTCNVIWEFNMTLYFVRHGETDWNVKKKIQGKTDIPLNANGVSQARALASWLKENSLKVKRVYTSPQLRAAETARIVSDALEIECIVQGGLREMDLGEWEGMDWNTVAELYQERYDYWNTHRRHTRTPQGESYDDVLGRTLKTLKYILEQETQDVLVVTHSAVLMALRCYLANRPFEDMVPYFKTKNTGIVEVESEEIRRAVLRYEVE